MHEDIIKMMKQNNNLSFQKGKFQTLAKNDNFGRFEFSVEDSNGEKHRVSFLPKKGISK